MKNINSSQLEVKLRRLLTKAERAEFVLPQDLQSILVGLYLGDLYGEKRNINPRLKFEQGLNHNDYLLHLYKLFEKYCSANPKITNPAPDKRTGKTYNTIRFLTYSLPCFAPLYELFYVNGTKVIPNNIGDLLTPLGLAYWICDDGCFCQRSHAIFLSTNSFTLSEVNNLVNVLNNKFGLICTINSQNGKPRIRISPKSLPVIQSLLEPAMPSMMRFKIGLS